MSVLSVWPKKRDFLNFLGCFGPVTEVFLIILESFELCTYDHVDVDFRGRAVARLLNVILCEQDTAVVLGREQQRLEEEVEAVQNQVEVIGAILEEMERCQSGASASTLHEKELVYRRLKAQYPQEYLLYNLADAALSQVTVRSEVGQLPNCSRSF